MTTGAICKKLAEYMQVADDKKLKPYMPFLKMKLSRKKLNIPMNLKQNLTVVMSTIRKVVK